MITELLNSETQGATRGDAQEKGKADQGGCCGGAAPQGVDACCALDAEVKATGGVGCGCARRAASRDGQQGRCC